MRELLNRTKERLRSRREEKESPPNAAEQDPKTLQSVDGIGEMWARHVREGLAQLAEPTITDRMP